MVLLFSGLTTWAQLVAADDTVPTVNSSTTQFGVYNVLNNDTWNGAPVSSSLFTVTQISSSHPSIQITQNGWVTVYQGVPAGSYTLTYQICQNSNPGNCATETVTINICTLTAPIVVAEGGCNDPGSITLYGLPENGLWEVTVEYNNTVIGTYQGTGDSYTLSGLVPGAYRFRVTYNGCTSPYSITEYIGFLDGFWGSMTGQYVDVNGDGVINIGDEIQYDIELMNMTECDITDIYISGGMIESAFVPGMLSPWQTVNFPAVYYITQDDINNGFVSQWAGISGMINGASTYIKLFTDPIELDIVSGFMFVAFVDDNMNGIQDPGEENFSNGYFSYSINNVSSPIIAASGADNFILYETDTNNTYDVDFSIYGACNGAFTVTPGSYDDISIQGMGISTYHFAVTATVCHDTAIFLSPLSNPRPNLTYSQLITYINYGTDPIASGTITFNADPLVMVTNVSQSGATTTSSGFTYNFTNLQPGEYRYISVTMQVPNVPTVNIGDILTGTATISAPSGDTNPTNNSSTRSDVVTNSYDPNDISENHGPEIVHSEFDANESLIYTVRFENIGTANAIDVMVLNTLHERINPGTLRIVTSSHPYVMQRTDDAFSMTFAGIELPPSIEGTDIGKGYFIYEVKLHPGIQPGDVITNQAEIIFDSNPSIFTNMWTTEFVTALGTQQHSLANLAVYPNPSTGMITVRSESTIENISVSDVMGKKIMTRNFSSDNVSIDISDLSSGVYFLAVQSGRQMQTVRIVKQ